MHITRIVLAAAGAVALLAASVPTHAAEVVTRETTVVRQPRRPVVVRHPLHHRHVVVRRTVRRHDGVVTKRVIRRVEP